MMRSPGFVVTAVRNPAGRIVIRSSRHQSWTSRFPQLRRPVLRGVVTLVESLIQGMDSLSFSARIQAQGEGEGTAKPVIGRGEILLTFAVAFAMAIGLFVVLPHFLAWLIGTDGVVFHIVDGLFKIGILLAYVYLIGRMPEIRRVFEYHGAEHKSIYAFERGGGLIVANARAQSTLHPRCGTSFLLFVVVISVVVFTILLPALGVTGHVAMIGAKALLMFPVAGLAYEVIRASAYRMESPVFGILVLPGLWLQKLTTRVPADDQLEVALVALTEALSLEKNSEADRNLGEREISCLAELDGAIQGGVTVAEFAEA